MLLKGKHILLVDDDLLLQRAYARVLVANGATVDTACNGREAVTKTMALHPDAVLMDVNMPVMSGLRAASEIRQHCPTCTVLMSSMNVATEAHALGCHFIGKGDPTGVLTAVQQALDTWAGQQ